MCFYCTICLYCSLYVVYVLPIQLLGCHTCNKRLSCLDLLTSFLTYLLTYRPAHSKYSWASLSHPSSPHSVTLHCGRTTGANYALCALSISCLLIYQRKWFCVPSRENTWRTGRWKKQWQVERGRGGEKRPSRTTDEQLGSETLWGYVMRRNITFGSYHQATRYKHVRRQWRNVICHCSQWSVLSITDAML